MTQNLQRRAMAPARSIGITAPARAILHLIVVVTMLALFAGPARAGIFDDIGGFVGDVGDWITGKDSVPGIASDAACNRYAEEAIVAAVQNEQLGCGFGGGRYTRDRNAHFRWCKQQLTRGEHLLGEAAENETNIRNDDLARCSRCNEYENQANGAARQNRIFHCGGTGDRWGSGNGHKKWCMGVRQSTADGETNARNAVVNQCRAKFTPAQLRKCDEYANNAVRQAKINACGHTGPRWTQDRDAHFAFCTWGWEHDIGGTDVVTAMKTESDARDADNASCQNTQAQRPSPFGGKQFHAITPPTTTMSATIRDNPAAAQRIPRQPPAVVPAAPREPILAQPVVTGGSGGVSPARPVVVPALPTGSISAPPAIRIEGTIDPLAWKHKLPPDLYRPKWPGGVPPATGETRPGTGGWYPSRPYPPTPGTPPTTGGTGGASTSKPIPPVPGTPPTTGGTGGASTSKPIPPVPGTPPATGGTGGINTTKPNPPTPSTPPPTGGTGGVSTSKPIPPVPSAPPATGGSGGINLTKPIPPAATPNASSDLYLRNSRTKPDSTIALRNKPLPADLFKPKASGGVPLVKSYGTKADSPVAWKHRPLRPAISKPAASTGALPIRSNATAGSVATKPPVVLQRRPVASSGSAFARRAPTIRTPSAGMARARPSLVR